MYRARFSMDVLSGEDSFAAIGIESGMPPLIQKGDHVLGDFAFFQKHLEHMVSEEAFQSPAIDSMRHGEQAAFVETAVGNQDMQMGIKPEKIAEGLNGDGRTGNCC